MKFSIATPLYNGMPKIRQCIGSVRGQLLSTEARGQSSEVRDRRSEVGDQRSEVRDQKSEYSGQKSERNGGIEIQHIIQDGGSTDGSVEFLKEFQSRLATKDSLKSEHSAQASRTTRNPQLNNYQLKFASESDAGMYEAINRAWAKADGDILSWLNHDEQYLPGTLQKVADYFERHPAMDVVFGDYLVVDPYGIPLAARREIPVRKLYLSNGFLYALSCTMFFRRKLLDEQLLTFDTQYRVAGDLDLMLRLVENGKDTGHIDSYLSLFGVDGDNLSVTLGDNMNREKGRIQKQYGKLRSPLRESINGLRCLERLIKGCYKRDDISFQYAVDEVPKYRTVERNNVKFRFTYDLAEKQINRMRQHSRRQP